MKLAFEKKSARVELIPLIDIVFLLLVFFIYSMLSMVVYRGIPVDLPSAESTGTKQGEFIVITIDDWGRIFLDREEIEDSELPGRLKDIITAYPDRAVIISGDQESPYRVFVDVLDQVRLAGFQKVSIEAMPREGR